MENKCSEHGFVVPNTVKLISHSVGYFEPARFTGDAVYYVKAEGMVLYPADGIIVDGEVIRKNKMGLYLNYRDGLRIQVPRDLNLTEELKEEFETVEIGDVVRVNLKKSLFQINDEYILTNGLFIKKVGGVKFAGDEAEAEGAEGEAEAEVAEGEAEAVAEAGTGEGEAGTGEGEADTGEGEAENEEEEEENENENENESNENDNENENEEDEAEAAE